MSKTLDIELLSRIADAIVAIMGNSCEVLIYDLTKPECSIAYIVNGEVSGRDLNSGISEAVIDALTNKDVPDKNSYIVTSKGKTFKSSTIYIKDDYGVPIGVLAINLDITEIIGAYSKVADFIKPAIKDETKKVELTSLDVGYLLDELIERSVKEAGANSPNYMTREQKISAVHYLQKHGALLIKGSGDRISSYFGISKFTLYNYLDLPENKNDNDLDSNKN